MKIYEDNSQSIGNTPLVRLNRVVDPGGARVLAKIEGRNPSYSVKCRIGAAMIWDAEKSGVLTRVWGATSRRGCMPTGSLATRWHSTCQVSTFPRAPTYSISETAWRI